MIKQADLNQFTGTTQYYAHWLKAFLYTDGVKYLADEAQAYWLIDAIASHQPEALKDPMLRGIQFWKLIVTGNKAKLICERDTDNVAITQDIDYTDFPLSEVKLYLADRVLMLPSEY